MTHTIQRIWVAAAMLVLATPALAAKPVARILDVQGKVTIERSKDSVRPAQVFGTVYEGEKLLVAEKSGAVLAFRGDGHLERLKPGSTATAAAAGCRPATAVEQVAVAQGEQDAVGGAIRELKPVTQGGVTIVRSPGRNGGPPPLPPRTSPIVGATIASQRPTFSWPSVQNAASYEVEVSSGGERLWTGKTEKTTLEYGAKTLLQAGFAYRWQVLATMADGSAKQACEGEFTVGADPQRDRAAEMARLAAGDEPARVALAAAWLEENGFAEEALAAHERLARLMPEAAPVQAVLFDLYARAGRPEDAAKAREAFLRLRPPPPKPDWLKLPRT